MMTPSALHAKMLELSQRYKAALDAHELGRAGLVRDEAAIVLASNWAEVLAALDEWAEGDRPLNAQDDNVPEDEDFGEEIPF